MKTKCKDAIQLTIDHLERELLGDLNRRLNQLVQTVKLETKQRAKKKKGKVSPISRLGVGLRSDPRRENAA
jgi:hypothetical protein